MADATIQEIHLELFRRSVASEYSTDEFIAILPANRHLWRGAIMDRLGISEGGHWLQPASMIKLRDIDQDFWNADTLHLLCVSRAAADELAAKLPMERFACMPSIVADAGTIDRALGGADDGMVILRLWWD